MQGATLDLCPTEIYPLSFSYVSPDYCTKTEPNLRSAWANMQVGSKARGFVRVFTAQTFLNFGRSIALDVPALEASSYSSRQQWQRHSAFSSLSFPFSGTFLISSLYRFRCWENDGIRNESFSYVKSTIHLTCSFIWLTESTIFFSSFF